MPELAQLKFNSDFINTHNNKVFTKIEKSPVSKIKCVLDLQLDKCKVEAECRGKELKINFLEPISNNLLKSLKVQLGMSGEFIYYNPNDTLNEKIHRNTHLRLYDEDGNVLGMRDFRRFGRWEWGDFDLKKSPCPFNEPILFQQNILNNFQTNKDFKRPLFEIMMNQKWFNGIGNYLRAEILDKLDTNPFVPFNTLSIEIVKNLLVILQQTIQDEYVLGGGKIDDAKYSFKERSEHLQCYKKKESVMDRNKRLFWFDKKWLIEKEKYKNTQYA